MIEIGCLISRTTLSIKPDMTPRRLKLTFMDSVFVMTVRDDRLTLVEATVSSFVRKTLTQLRFDIVVPRVLVLRWACGRTEPWIVFRIMWAMKQFRLNIMIKARTVLGDRSIFFSRMFWCSVAYYLVRLDGRVF